MLGSGVASFQPMMLPLERFRALEADRGWLMAASALLELGTREP